MGSLEVAMSLETAWRIYDQEGKKQNKIDLEPDSLLVASSPETGPEASLSSRTMQSLKLTLWIQALRSCKMHPPTLSLRKAREGAS